MSDIVKQVIVMRKDLNMRKGKMISQGCHASVAVLLKYGEVRGQDDNYYQIQLNEDMKEWLSGSFTKICVSVDSEEQLLALYYAANKAEIICGLIQDAGRTEFDGVPTYTALAIGPAKASVIDKLTGDLKLL